MFIAYPAFVAQRHNVLNRNDDFCRRRIIQGVNGVPDQILAFGSLQIRHHVLQIAITFVRQKAGQCFIIVRSGVCRDILRIHLRQVNIARPVMHIADGMLKNAHTEPVQLVIQIMRSLIVIAEVFDNNIHIAFPGNTVDNAGG